MAKIVKTLCRMCTCKCGLNVFVENNKVTKVEGMPEHPVSKGGLCTKGLLAVELEYSQKRLEHPIKRVGERGEGRWKAISWEEALDEITNRLREIKAKYGAQAVVWHRGTGAGWGSNWIYAKRLMNLFGSPNIAAHSHLCHTPREIAQIYTYGHMTTPDYENAKCIMLWGFNPAYSYPTNHARRIINAKEKGAKLIVVDPRLTEMASKADVFVQPRPGTDGALALGIMNVIINEGLYDREFVEKWTVGFDRLVELVQEYTPEKVEKITWVPTDVIEKVARVHATTKPAVVAEGNGIDQHTNVVQTARALAILRSITGSLDVPGGNVFLPSPHVRARAEMTLKKYLPKDIKSVSKHPLYYQIQGVSTPEVVDAILTEQPYPIKALIVEASGLGVTASNSNRVADALLKLDFIVVYDVFMTAVAKLADVVLPAATFLETSLLEIYSDSAGPSVDTRFVALQKKAVDPLVRAWPDSNFIFELAKRMGYGEYFWNTVEEAFNQELVSLGLTIKELKEQPEGICIKYELPDLYRKYEKNGFATITKKVDIYSAVFEQHGYDPLPIFREPAESPTSSVETAEKYPLVCGTGLKPGIFTHSRYRILPFLNSIIPEPFVEIHLQMAEELGIRDGDTVLVESPRGIIEVKAKVTEMINPNVVMVAHGWGQPYANAHGAKTNILTDDSARCPVSGATGNRSFLCRIRRI